MSKTSLGERERVARIIDPRAWELEDAGAFAGYAQQKLVIESSLAKADLILSALLPEEGQGLSSSNASPGPLAATQRSSDQGDLVLVPRDLLEGLAVDLMVRVQSPHSTASDYRRTQARVRAAAAILHSGPVSTPPATPALGLIEGEQGSSNAISGPTPKSADTKDEPSAVSDPSTGGGA